MNRLVLAGIALALVLPAAAAAKGPSSASVTGPGLDKALVIAGEGESSGTPLGDLSVEAGFFPAAFGQEPSPMLASAPTKKLGPKLTIHYVVPGPNNDTFRIAQDAYPYARGGAVTYMKPGQPIFDMTTHGGWYRADGLKRTLVEEGLPARAARAARSSSSSNLRLLAGIGIPGALVAVGAALFVARRRGRSAS
jgi:hypothetical protein